MLVMAELQADGSYLAGPPEWPPTELLGSLRRCAGAGTALVGFDFPIGLPEAYATRAGVDTFPTWLGQLENRSWDLFRSPAVTPNEICLKRPFYPFRPGGASLNQLVAGLRLESKTELMRRCDREAKAAPMFWTLGAKQVGKAALAGWHEVLRPVLRASDRTAVWPFQGSLERLLSKGHDIVAETYPASFYRAAGVEKPFGKKKQPDRKRVAPGIQTVAQRAGLVANLALARAIDDGFGTRADGENAFDAVIGLVGMLLVLRGLRPADPPDEPAVRRVEGWMLGLDPATLRR